MGEPWAKNTLTKRRRIDSPTPNPDIKKQKSSNTSAQATPATSVVGVLVDKVHLIGPGSGKKAHVPKLWSGYAYKDRFEYEYGSQGETLKSDFKFPHECHNNSPKDHLDKLVKEKLKKGYNYKS